MPPWIEVADDLAAGREAIRRGRYGVIETHAGRLVSVTLRPWPKLLSLRELWPVGDSYHERGPADRCRLYYNQPRRHAKFLALKYVATTGGTSYRTFLSAVRVLDRIAEIKQADALLCDAANGRLSDRFMARMGWEPHAPMPWRRNFIKRFYGSYPGAAAKPACTAGEPTSAAAEPTPTAAEPTGAAAEPTGAAAEYGRAGASRPVVLTSLSDSTPQSTPLGGVLTDEQP
ncbi:hypothetical protein Pla123a_17270 [Posidoniimonas polymericola]|uniref:Uncharacterized protein n=1 Tax=Posidoniimonas polymericola TaxID=2528002 RepID=A0A5C5YSN9_9BACT|nr:hypothetical protein [Posidoniimonas polymericola]TWT77928.1 hypothetical protein Pla123a_17270 [Posidoniimonas polymericola]